MKPHATSNNTTEERRAWVQAELARRMRVENPRRHVALLPPERFSDEYSPADPRFNEPRGANAGAITGLLAGSCCGWGRKPSAAEFHDAVRETEPTPRQRAIINVLITEASNDTIALAYLQGAFTWRQLATAMRRHGNYSPRLTRYVNLHADASHEAT